MRHAEASWNVRGAFTLIELLVVVGIVSTFAIFVVRADGSGAKLSSLHAGQAAVANLVTLARVRAGATGQPTRIAVSIDVTTPAASPRFLCYCVAQIKSGIGWQTFADCWLPANVYILPGNFASIPGGLFSPSAGPWVRNDGVAALRSTALRASMISNEPILNGAAEDWVSVEFAAVGATAQSGDVVLTLGERRSPGTYAEGESPIQLRNPDAVRGLTLSSYGICTLIENRRSF